MRSTSRAAVPAEQALPLGVPDEGVRPRRARAKRPAAEFVHRLGSDALASFGLPAGTQIIVDTTQRPRRGQILFVRTQGRLRVGVLDVQFGRSVLRSDRGTVWLDPATEIWGVATAADPPIEGLCLAVEPGD